MSKAFKLTTKMKPLCQLMLRLRDEPDPAPDEVPARLLTTLVKHGLVRVTNKKVWLTQLGYDVLEDRPLDMA